MTMTTAFEQVIESKVRLQFRMETDGMAVHTAVKGKDRLEFEVWTPISA